MLTRRRLLAALAGLPGVALVAKLWKRDAPIDCSPEASRLFLFEAPPPRVVTVAERFGPKDKTIFFGGRSPGGGVPPHPRRGDIIIFPKAHGHRVILLVKGYPADGAVGEPVPAHDYLAIRAVDRIGDGISGFRITLQPGDTGFIYENASEEQA